MTAAVVDNHQLLMNWWNIRPNSSVSSWKRSEQMTSTGGAAVCANVCRCFVCYVRLNGTRADRARRLGDTGTETSITHSFTHSGDACHQRRNDVRDFTCRGLRSRAISVVCAVFFNFFFISKGWPTARTRQPENVANGHHRPSLCWHVSDSVSDSETSGDFHIFVTRTEEVSYTTQHVRNATQHNIHRLLYFF